MGLWLYWFLPLLLTKVSCAVSWVARCPPSACRCRLHWVWVEREREKAFNAFLSGQIKHENKTILQNIKLPASAFSISLSSLVNSHQRYQAVRCGTCGDALDSCVFRMNHKMICKSDESLEASLVQTEIISYSLILSTFLFYTSFSDCICQFANLKYHQYLI